MAWTKENKPSFSENIDGAPTEGLWTPTDTQRHRFGARYEDGHGRVFRYVKAGSTELAAGLMTQAEAGHGDVDAITQTGYTTAIGDKRIRCLFTTTNGIIDDELVDAKPAFPRTVRGGFARVSPDLHLVAVCDGAGR